MTSQEKIEKFGEITKSMLDLYTRKNSDYGDSFEKTHVEYGITAFLVRAQDKINRLRSIDKKGNILVKDESIVDTLQDLATYAIMTQIELENDKRRSIIGKLPPGLNLNPYPPTKQFISEGQ